MMCACEEEFARRHLPHQLSHGSELHTRKEIAVTLGFQKDICNKCRGLPEAAAPKAELYGRSSKIARYYWREIAFETIKRISKWEEKNRTADAIGIQHDYQEIYEMIEREVIEEVKIQHEKSPKYVYQEESQSEVISRYSVEVVNLDGTYVKGIEGKGRLFYNGELFSAENFVANHYAKLGYNVLFTESTPFHTLFGIFMWLVIQSPDDPLNRPVAFGDRIAYEEKRTSKEIWTFLPEDFGTKGYYERRKTAIDKHLLMLREQNSDLLWLFDYWLEPSANFRQYLWAHRDTDITTARRIVEVLSANILIRILNYLVGDYWRKYLGWPDLLVFDASKFCFIEVKASKDHLSENQKLWIQDNHNELHLPFKIVKIHKKHIIT